MKRLDLLTFKQLRALEAVARTGSIARAADELSLTAPAVHSQLKTLTESFGCDLLTRDGAHGFHPTPEGRALLDAHRQSHAALSRAINRIESLRKGLAGTVVLGVVSTGKYFAPALVARLRQAHPDIEVVLRIGNRDAIIAALQDGAIDVAIMGRPPRDPPVIASPIGDNPHSILAPPGHPLHRDHPVSAEELLAETFILREPGSGTRILATRYLDRVGEGLPYVALEMESNETIKQAVMAGLGIAMLSLHTVAEELRQGRLVLVKAPDLPIVRQWYVLHRSDIDVSGALRTVLAFIEAEKDRILPTGV